MSQQICTPAELSSEKTAVWELPMLEGLARAEHAASKQRVGGAASLPAKAIALSVKRGFSGHTL